MTQVPKVDYVVDTSVLLDLLGLDKDLSGSPMRRERAFYALASSLVFESRGSTTWQLHLELFKILDTTYLGKGRSLLYGKEFVDVVMGRVLTNWRPQLTLNFDSDVSGNDRDHLLVAKAEEFGVILISNETKIDGAIAKAKADRNVDVITTAEFCRSIRLAEADWVGFLARLRRESARINRGKSRAAKLRTQQFVQRVEATCALRGSLTRS